MYDLSGKVALVTGAARKRGIGRGIALRLAQEGADVAVNDVIATEDGLDPWDTEAGWRGLDSLVEEIRSLGRRAVAVPGDIAKSSDVDRMVARAVAELGHIDILVNNAGLMSRELGVTPVVDASEEVWRRGIEVNIMGLFLMSRSVARQMVRQGRGGKIISIASRSGKQPSAGAACYSLTKAATISFTQTLALELGTHKINVNSVCPGPVVSWGSTGRAIHEGMKKGMTEEEAATQAFATITYASRVPGPLGGLVKVDDVANVVAFLASNQSDYMTGQAINITGGRIMH